MTISYKPADLVTEGDVESKFLQELLSKVLGYDIHSDLRWKEPVKYNEGRKKVTKYADLVVYKDKKAVMVVEAKKPSESLIGNIGQLDSYALKKEVRYGVITNGRRFILREYLAGNKKANIVDDSISKLHEQEYGVLVSLISKINIESAKADNFAPFSNVTNEISDYRRFFRSIHNIIRDNEKLDPVSCFDEFSKILYLKMADALYREKGMNDKRFEIELFKNVPGQDPMKLINAWFKVAVQLFYDDIFEEIPDIKIGLITLENVLKKLEKFYVKDSNTDIKGRAFEAFLPSQLRGKGLGQFFTPRKIVDFMVDLASVDISDTVVDFACGSGGFLIKAFEQMKETLTAMPESSFKSIGTTKAAFEDNLKKTQIFGIDAEPRAVRVAKMNMILWGDGERVIRGNGLAQTDWQGIPYPLSEYNPEKEGSGCTLILANPPFIKEKNPSVLSQYTLADGKNSVDTHTLFLERGINLLRPGGRMLIVLPEGVLSNDSSLGAREYLLRNAKIKAVIGLPTHTFVQSGVDTVNTVVLYLEKYETELKEQLDKVVPAESTPKDNIASIIKSGCLDYDIFMATAENVGFEPNGRIFAKAGEKTDLDIILDEINNLLFKNKKHDIVGISLKDYDEDVKTFRGRQSASDCMKKGIKDIGERLDPAYYLFWKNARDSFKSFIPLSSYGIIFNNNKLEIETDDELDAEYIVCSVNKNNAYNLLEFSEYRTGEEIAGEAQKKLIADKGTVVYNPYRANIGSFAVVPEKYDKCLTSGAYINFTVERFDVRLLVALFKTPIYNKYIEILSTGSVRNNFSDKCLRNILVPKLTAKEQQELLSLIDTKENGIRSKRAAVKEETVNKMAFLYKSFGIAGAGGLVT